MGIGESPAAARRRVRLALRRARDARGLTQQQVADGLDWSLSKVNRLEKGEVTVSRTDLLALLEMYGVADSAVIDDLVGAARRSRQRGWYDEPRYRETLTTAMLQLYQFEAEATAIRFYHSTLIPGLLQTPAYAEYILNFWQQELADSVRAARLETRIHRRGHVFDRDDPPDYLLILDESVLHREVGGPKVMAEQLRDLLNMMARPNMHVRVLPLREAAILAMLGPFQLFDLGDEENAVLYRETVLKDEILFAGEAIDRHRGYFEQMWSQAFPEDASARLIEAQAAAMLSALDRYQPT
ncbi:helix-turn-helix domain-containing protein [Phytohabitans rumicis]|nr:helix-turn-helix transcriptional regulator [Phytohabitans rumicis]